MAAGRLLRVGQNAASRLTGAAPLATWRDEVDSLREAHKWDSALETYRRLGKDKDASIEVLVLGQKALAEGNHQEATDQWALLAGDGGGQFSHYVGSPALSSCCILRWGL